MAPDGNVVFVFVGSFICLVLLSVFLKFHLKGSRGGTPFVMTAMGYNIRGEGLFPRVLKFSGTLPSSGDSWDAPPLPLKEWGYYIKICCDLLFSSHPFEVYAALHPMFIAGLVL